MTIRFYNHLASMAQSVTKSESLKDAATTLHEQVAGVLNLIRPAVQSDGGDIELVDVTSDGVVLVRLHGACVGCPSSTMTLQAGIERNLKQRVPGVTAVHAVT
jgi:Fe-S cluster biogenesis protein NfuA